MKRKTAKILAAVSGALIVLITMIMDFILFPRIEATTEGIKSFDLNSFGYSFEQAQKYLSLLSDEGRNLYLHVQLPLDFIYPVIYTVFFISMLYLFSKSIKITKIFPILLFVFDCAENVLTIVMLKAETLSPSLALSASCLTIAKTCAMYITILIILVQIILYNIRKRKTAE